MISVPTTASQEWYAKRKKDRNTAMSGEMMCKKCCTVKCVTEFGTHPNMANGRRTTCKKCRSSETLDWFNNRGGKRLRTIEKKRKYRATQIKRFPEKYRARNSLAYAIRSGGVVAKTSCEMCGGSGVLHGHHDDYSRPLDVKWLCISCHTTEHTDK